MTLSDELIKQLTPGFEGSDGERRRIAEALVSADLSSEYGLVIQAIAETQAGSQKMTTAVQNLVAQRMTEVFHDAHDQYVKDFRAKNTSALMVNARAGSSLTAPLDFNAYFAYNPQAYQDVLSQPIDLSLQSKAFVPGRQSQLGKMFPAAFGVSTVGGAMSYLSATQMGSVWQQVTRPYRNTQGQVDYRKANLDQILDEFQAGNLRALENMHNFDPAKGNFTVFATDQAGKGIRDQRRAERAWRTASIPGSFLASGESEDGSDFGMEINGETGEWIGDSAESLWEQGTGMPDFGGYSAKPVRPLGDWRNYVEEIQARFPEDQNSFANFNVQSGVFGQSFNLQTGKFGDGKDAGSYRLLGIDPNSPFAQATGQEGDLWQSFGRLLRSEMLPQFLDALENGTPIQTTVQRMVGGQILDIPLTINPGPIAGRTIESGTQSNWIDNLAGMMDPDYGGKMFAKRGTWAEVGGEFVYQDLAAAASPTGSRTQIPTSLWTSSPGFASGMRQNERGAWMLAPLSSEPSDEFNVPVTLNPTSVKKFGQLYENWNDVWSYYRESYNEAWSTAREIVYNQSVKARNDHKGMISADFDYNARLRKEFAGRLPGDVPRPGTALYNHWQNGDRMLGELRELEKSMTGATPPDPQEMTVELFDTSASMNVKVDNGESNRRYGDFTADLSSAGNFLDKERRNYYNAFLQRGQRPGSSIYLPNNPADQNVLQMTTARLRARRKDPITPAFFLSGDISLMDDPLPGLENGGGGAASPLTRLTAAHDSSARRPEPAYGMPDESFSLRDVRAKAAEYFQPYTTLKSHNALGTLGIDLGYGERDTTAMELAQMTRNAELNRFSSFSLSSLSVQNREDDWGWERRNLDERLRNALSRREIRWPKHFQHPGEPYKERENTYDNSILGGNPSSEEYLSGLADMGDDDPPVASIDHLNLTRFTNSLSATNDRELTARTRNDIERGYEQDPTDVDSEIADTSDLGGALSDEQQAQRALSLIADPYNENASLANRVASEAAAHGVFNISWRDFFAEDNKLHQVNKDSYNALSADVNSEVSLSNELKRNMTALQRGKRKAELMRTLLGENPVLAREMEKNKHSSQAKYYREVQKQISEDYDLGLNLEIGGEGDLYDQIQALATSNPQAYSELQHTFASPGDQLVVSRQYMALMGRVPGTPVSNGRARKIPTPAQEFSKQTRELIASRQEKKTREQEQYVYNRFMERAGPPPQLVEREGDFFFNDLIPLPGDAFVPGDEPDAPPSEVSFIHSSMKNFPRQVRHAAEGIALSMLADVYSAGTFVNRETHEVQREGGGQWYWSMYDGSGKNAKKSLHRNIQKRLEAIMNHNEDPDDVLTQRLKGEIFGQLTGQVPSELGYGGDEAFAGYFGTRVSRPRRLSEPERVELDNGTTIARSTFDYLASRHSREAVMQMDKSEANRLASRLRNEDANRSSLPRRAADPDTDENNPPSIPEPEWDNQTPWEYSSFEEDFETVAGDVPFIDPSSIPNTPEAQAAWKYFQETGDLMGAREGFLAPLPGEGSPRPARNLPHFTADMRDRLGVFKNKRIEEGGYLIGRYNDEGGVDVFDVFRPAQEKSGSTATHTRITPRMAGEALRYAESQDGFVAGSVHTHPSRENRALQNLRPSKTDFSGLMNPDRWEEDTPHVIYNPNTGDYEVWNAEGDAVRNVTQEVANPSTVRGQVGPRGRSRVSSAGNVSQRDYEDLFGEAAPPNFTGGSNGNGNGGLPPNLPPPPDEPPDWDMGPPPDDFEPAQPVTPPPARNTRPAAAPTPARASPSARVPIRQDMVDQASEILEGFNQRIAEERDRLSPQLGNTGMASVLQARVERFEMMGSDALRDLTTDEIKQLVSPEERIEINAGSPATSIAGRVYASRNRRPIDFAEGLYQGGNFPDPPDRHGIDPGIPPERLTDLRAGVQDFDDRWAEITRRSSAGEDVLDDVMGLRTDQQEYFETLSDSELMAVMPESDRNLARQGKLNQIQSRQGNFWRNRQSARDVQVQTAPNSRGRVRTEDGRHTLPSNSRRDPGAFPKTPQANWVLERQVPSRNADGSWGADQTEALEARPFGAGNDRHMGWGRLNDQTGAYEEVPGIDYGLITADGGEIIADVSVDERRDYDARELRRRTPARSLRPHERGHHSTPEEKAMLAAQGVPLKDALGNFYSRSMGRPTEHIDRATGNPTGTFDITQKDVDGSDITTLNSMGVQHAYDVSMGGVASSLQGPLPANAVNKVATIKDRIKQAAFEQVDKEVEEMISRGDDPSLARAHGSRLKEVVGHIAGKLGDKVVSTMANELGVSAQDVKAAASADVRLKSLDEVSALVERSPRVRQQLNGHSPEEIWAGGKSFIVDDEDKNTYDIGSGGYRRGGQFGGNHGGGIWSGGKFGAAMYAGYMLTREWQMLMGQHMQNAEVYGKYVSQMGVVGLPEGVSAGSTDVGYMARQEVGQHYMGRGAYEVLGGFQDIPFLMSGYGGAPARLATNVGMAGGVAAGGYLLGQGLGMMGMGGTAAGAAVVGALGPIGLGVGATILGGSLLMEAYNAIAQPEEPASWGNMFRGAEKMFLQNKGWDPAKDTKFGKSYNERTDEFQALSQSDWANQKGKYRPSNDEIAAELTWQEAQTYLYQGTPDEVEKMLDAAGRITTETGESMEDIQAGFYMQKRLTGKIDHGDFATKVSQNAMNRGMTSGMLLNEAGQYAALSGFKPGDKQFEEAFQEYGNEEDIGEAELMQYESRSWAQYGNQIQPMMPAGDKSFYGRGIQIARRYGINNQRKASTYASAVNAVQQFSSGDMTGAQFERIAALLKGQSPEVGGVIGQAMQMGGLAGMTESQQITLGEVLSGAGMSNQDASVYSRMMQGDLKAYSYQAWQTRNSSSGGNLNNAFYDQSGRSIVQFNGSTAMQVYNAWAPKVGIQGSLTSQQFLGTDNAEINAAFNQDGNQGGFYGLQMLANEKSYAASMASIGVQLKGIALSENFYWGSKAGGSWDNPTSGSAWGIEDRQRALSDLSARANFEDQWTRMTLGNEFAIKREGNQLQRMNASNQFSQWQWGAQYNQFNQQQGWVREDWQFQDTTRNLNFGWQMEDLNEAIRFSSGRERKTLLKQRDRAALSHNLEDDQIDTQRERQEKLWAQEDERFQKQKQYMDELQQLDREGFNINKDQREAFYKLDTQAYQRRLKEYEEEKKLSEELQELQRKFQYDQLQLQKEAAGAQAAAAAAQYEINKAIAEGQKKWEELTGKIGELNTYNNVFRIVNATGEMFGKMDTLSTYRLAKLIDLINAIGTANPTRSDERYGGERE